MGPLLSLFGGDNVVISVLLALAAVLVLIILAVWALKLVFNATGRASRGRAKRLGVVDVTAVDQKRQLVLVRRDNVEHLLLIGGAQDVVVESGIVAEPAGARAARPGAQQPIAPPPAPAAGLGVPAVTPPRARSTNLPPELASLRKPAAPARNSLRHTGLLRTPELREPEFFPSPPEPSPSAFADSDKQTGAEPVPTDAGAGSSEPDNGGEPNLERDGDDPRSGEAHEDSEKNRDN